MLQHRWLHQSLVAGAVMFSLLSWGTGMSDGAKSLELTPAVSPTKKEMSHCKTPDSTEFLCATNCIQTQIEYNPDTRVLLALETLIAGVWQGFPVEVISEEGAAAANQALVNATQNGTYRVLCHDPCHCELTNGMAPWSPWQAVDVIAPFEFEAPMNADETIQFRAIGTVEVRSRMGFGTCDRPQI